MAKKAKKTKDAQITDMLLDDFDKFEHFMVNNLRNILIGCVILIVLVAIGAIGYSIYNASENKANDAIAAADTIPELQQVIKKYSGREAVWSAYQKMIKIQVGKKDFAAALENSRALLALNVPEEMRWPLELNIGYLLEMDRKLPEAVTQFAAITKDNTFPTNVRMEAYYSAGRLELEQHHDAAAKSYLEVVAKEQPDMAAGESTLWPKMALMSLTDMQKLEQAISRDGAGKKAAAPAGK
ncbi:MAG: hypothetical protein PHQ27_00300 [Victivallales bacterium]|nr:hypothetical protein [Victivallales bacterium]